MEEGLHCLNTSPPQNKELRDTNFSPKPRLCNQKQIMLWCAWCLQRIDKITAPYLFIFLPNINSSFVHTPLNNCTQFYFEYDSSWSCTHGNFNENKTWGGRGYLFSHLQIFYPCIKYLNDKFVTLALNIWMTNTVDINSFPFYR